MNPLVYWNSGGFSVKNNEFGGKNILQQELYLTQFLKTGN